MRQAKHPIPKQAQQQPSELAKLSRDWVKKIDTGLDSSTLFTYTDNRTTANYTNAADISR